MHLTAHSRRKTATTGQWFRRQLQASAAPVRSQTGAEVEETLINLHNDNRQIDNLTNFRQIDNLFSSKTDSAIPLPCPHGLGNCSVVIFIMGEAGLSNSFILALWARKLTIWCCCYLYHWLHRLGQVIPLFGLTGQEIGNMVLLSLSLATIGGAKKFLHGIGNWQHGVVATFIMGQTGLTNFFTLASWDRKLATWCCSYLYHGLGRAN